MSGGYFDYDQHRIQRIIDDINGLISNNNSSEIDDYGYKMWRSYSDSTIDEFKKGVKFLKLAQIYAQRIDWLVSGDDGEKTFHERLKEEIETIKL